MVRRYDNYFDPPHGGRSPTDTVVHAATVRYVEWGRRNGIRPSPEWNAANPPAAASPRAAKASNNRGTEMKK